MLQCAFRSHQARTEARSLCTLSYTRIQLFDQSLQTMGKKVQHQQEVERRERAATKLQAINRGAKSRQLVKEKVGRVGTYGDTHTCVSIRGHSAQPPRRSGGETARGVTKRVAKHVTKQRLKYSRYRAGSKRTRSTDFASVYLVFCTKVCHHSHPCRKRGCVRTLRSLSRAQGEDA